MNYEEVDNMLETCVGLLGYDATYDHGRLPEINKDKFNAYPLVFTLPFKSSNTEQTNTNVIRDWTVSGLILMKDKQNLSNSEYKEILYSSDTVIQDIINKINEQGYKIENISWSTSAIIKDTTKVLSGTSFIIRFRTYDTYNYCC